MFKRLVTVYYYHDVSFSSKTSKPGNKGLVTTMGKGSGEEVSSGWGGGGAPTVTVTFFRPYPLLSSDE